MNAAPLRPKRRPLATETPYEAAPAVLMGVGALVVAVVAAGVTVVTVGVVG